jgi:hypothetical protein
LIKQVADVLESAMNPTCASNVLSLICHSFFKECQQVEDSSTGEAIFLPALLCRSECERHWKIWNSCLAALKTDTDAKRHFDFQMQFMVPLSCSISHYFFVESWLLFNTCCLQADGAALMGSYIMEEGASFCFQSCRVFFLFHAI